MWQNRNSPSERQSHHSRSNLRSGGGFGDPRLREAQRVLDDVLDGLISAEEARRDYGVAIDADGRLDRVETERLRLS
jgi:N-methylhydantoinase B